MIINDNRYLKIKKPYNCMAYKDINVEPDEEKLSRLNAAGIINITLENLWRDCYSAMARGDLVLWNRKLDAIWVLLGGDVKKGETEDKNLKKLDESLYKIGSLNHKKAGFEKLKDDENVSIAHQYLLLKEKSLFLRRLQNTQGKGTAYQSDDNYDID